MGHGFHSELNKVPGGHLITFKSFNSYKIPLYIYIYTYIFIYYIYIYVSLSTPLNSIMMREMSDDFETWPGEVPALARGLCSPTRLHGSPRRTDMKIATFDSRRVVGKCLWLGDFSLPGNRFPGATRNRRSDSGIINHGNGKPPFFMGKSTINVHFQQLFVCLPKTSTPLANGLRTASYSSVDAFTIDVLCLFNRLDLFGLLERTHCKVIQMVHGSRPPDLFI